MATLVQEIMNRELYAARPADAVESVTASLLALGISACPVQDPTGRPLGMVSLRDLVAPGRCATIADRMTGPPVVVRAGSSIEEAGRLLAETGYHHLPVVDGEGRTLGMVSTLDVIRGLLGLPARHPTAFPHLDPETHLCWTDDRVLELDRIEAAPDGPGLLVLTRGAAHEREVVVWVEAPNNVRTRLLDILSTPQTERRALAHLLAEGGDRLRFRAAAVEEPTRSRLFERLRQQIGRA